MTQLCIYVQFGCCKACGATAAAIVRCQSHTLLCRIPGWILWPAGIIAVLQATLGTAAAFTYIAAAIGSICYLETINYVEHYGLQRRQLPSGAPERVNIGHSWNANHLFSNASLLRLQRHTDHHMHGHRPYYTLNSVEGAPKLPASYSVMLLMALVPPLWFVVMNPRVHIHRLLAEAQANAAQQGGSASESDGWSEGALLGP